LNVSPSLSQPTSNMIQPLWTPLLQS
jgi:hypothetical protein